MERYALPFTATIQMMKQEAEIAEKIGKISNYHSFETKRLPVRRFFAGFSFYC